MAQVLYEYLPYLPFVPSQRYLLIYNLWKTELLFLNLEREIPILADLQLGLSINWARSVLE
ncbi:MAG: hypothetical protein NTX25_09260 [Proteobacteria bacterium]|nr:hypothetical protein [Pseudomonadota bacterium]